jgi:hypothetical protein
MSRALDKDVETWESEGGAVPASLRVSTTSMSGTPNQVEWAERIKRRVDDEFDRVARSFRSVAGRQSEAKRAETEAILGFSKRSAVK